MLRGGSLFYALAIMVILGLLTTTLLLAAHYGQMSLQRDETNERVIRNARSGLELLMSDQSEISFDSPKEVDLFGQGNDSVWLEKRTWGAFEVFVSRAHKQSAAHELVALAGWQLDPGDKTALVLADLDRPLSLAGKTQLRGTCFLPRAGAQRAYIEGQGYSGDKLVYGEIKNSDRFLPAYDDTLVDRIKALFNFRPTGDAVLSFAVFAQTDSLVQSFRQNALYVYDPGPVRISNQFVSGQVCIISGVSIRVTKTAALHSVLLIAPKIVIEDEARGDFQAFARDSLIVGKKAKLDYPTVLGIVGTAGSPDFAALVVNEEAEVAGELFACSTANDFRKHALVLVRKDANLYGQLYSSDLVDLQGSVTGDVACTKFSLKTNSAEYENHLLNAVIDQEKRSPAFAASALTRKRTDRKTVVQWLD